MERNKIWELKQQAETPEVLEMYIYGNVEGDSYDWWEGREIKSETSANYFREELAKFPNVKQIKIFINSFGGYVFEGTGIYNQLKRHAAEKIVQVDGFACSVASLIAMAADKLIMPSNTMMMIHNAWVSASGDAKALRKSADDLDAMMEGNRQAYLAKSNGKITLEKLTELMDNGTWLTAKQCLEYGFADEITSTPVDMTQAEEMLQKVNQSLTAKISYNTAVAAQLRDMATPNTTPEAIIIPAPEDPQAKVEQPSLSNLFNMFNKK